MIRIGVPWLSLNKVLRMGRTAKVQSAKRVRWVEGFRATASALWCVAQKFTPAEDEIGELHARVILTRVSARFIDDRDNLYGGAKLVCDALKCSPILVNGLKTKYMTWGLFFDDSDRFLELTCVQQKPKGLGLPTLEPGTYIEISWHPLDS